MRFPRVISLKQDSWNKSRLLEHDKNHDLQKCRHKASESKVNVLPIWRSKDAAEQPQPFISRVLRKEHVPLGWRPATIHQEEALGASCLTSRLFVAASTDRRRTALFSICFLFCLFLRGHYYRLLSARAANRHTLRHIQYECPLGPRVSNEDRKEANDNARRWIEMWWWWPSTPRERVIE